MKFFLTAMVGSAIGQESCVTSNKRGMGGLGRNRIGRGTAPESNSREAISRDFHPRRILIEDERPMSWRVRS